MFTTIKSPILEKKLPQLPLQETRKKINKTQYKQTKQLIKMRVEINEVENILIDIHT